MKKIHIQIVLYLQDILEDMLNELYIGSLHSIKKLVNIGANPEALHLTNKREIEELKIRLQSPECLEAAINVITKNRSKM